MTLVPAGLAERIVAHHNDGAAWLDELPTLVERCATQWGLTVLDAYEPGGDASWVAPVRRRDGEAAVLRMTVPSAAQLDQAVALRTSRGRGAVELYEDDETMWASLVECCVPSAERTVLLHGDFHRRNVLRSARGWLAVDPAPRLGDPAFDVACFLQHDMDDPSTIVRADRLSEQLDLDPARTRQWLYPVAVQAASWFLCVGDESHHRAIMSVVAQLADDL